MILGQLVYKMFAKGYSSKVQVFALRISLAWIFETICLLKPSICHLEGYRRSEDEATSLKVGWALGEAMEMGGLKDTPLNLESP